MAQLCNTAPTFFRAQPGRTGRNFTQPIVTRRLQTLLCCAARTLFRLKSIAVMGEKQVSTGHSMLLTYHVILFTGKPFYPCS